MIKCDLPSAVNAAGAPLSLKKIMRTPARHADLGWILFLCSPEGLYRSA
jgi:hypothetical protein